MATTRHVARRHGLQQPGGGAGGDDLDGRGIVVEAGDPRAAAGGTGNGPLGMVDGGVLGGHRGARLLAGPGAGRPRAGDRRDRVRPECNENLM